MNLPPDAATRLDAYLSEVERHLSPLAPAVRREVIAGLRDQAAETFRRASGPGTDEERMDRVLAEMDPPESFDERDGALPPAAPARRAPRPGGLGWFLLGLAFLLLNAYGVWRATHPRAPVPTPAADSSASSTEALPALRLLTAEQTDVSANGQVSLRLVFSEAPDRDRLTHALRLETEEGNVDYILLRQADPKTVIAQTLPVETDAITVRLMAGAAALAGAAPSAVEWRSVLTVRRTLILRRVQAETPAFEQATLTADFSTLPEPTRIADFVSIEPAVRYSVTVIPNWRGGGIQCVGDFQPGAIYSVTFKAGLPAANGSKLADSMIRTVQFPNRPAAIQCEASGRYLAPHGRLLLPITTVNLPEWTLSLSPVGVNNLVQLALREGEDYPYYGSLDYNLTGDATIRTNRTLGALNECVATALPLRDALPKAPHGVYWMELNGPKASGVRQLIVISDLGLSARLFPGGALVWVNSLQSAEPVGGATVTLYGRNNVVLGSGETGADGLVRLDTLAPGDPFLVVAQAGTDLSYLDLERGKIESGLGGRDYGAPDALDAAVFTERGVYRPGESVFLQALVRTHRMDAPAPFPALFRVMRPDGRVFQDLPVLLDTNGAAHAVVQLPEFLPTGRYSLKLVLPGSYTELGATSVALEDFVPPQIRVTVRSPETRQPAGAPLKFQIEAEHLFGRPAAGLAAEGFATIRQEPFTPTNWPGWTFGDADRPFAVLSLPLGKSKLDDQGRADFEVETRTAWRPPAALRVVQQATVTEAGGRAISAYHSTVVDPYPFYIGLRPAWEGRVRLGETQRVRLAEIAPDGQPFPGEKPLTLTLARIQWLSVLRQTRDAHYEWTSEKQSTPVLEDTLAAGGEPREWTFSVTRAGEYELTAGDPASGASTRLRFYAAPDGQDWIEWNRERPDRVDLQWDRETYRPGDTARLSIRAPFAGTALLTLESDRVLQSRVLRLEKNTAEIEIPVEANFAPNVYVSLTLLRPAQAETVWSPHRAIGLVALCVKPPDRGLSVALAVPETTLPQTRLSATVRVQDENGQPATGVVTVLAVDEGLCLLTDFVTPDPNALFFARRAPGVMASDLYRELMPIVDEGTERTPRAGGDGGAELRKRLNPIRATRFKPLSLWKADLPLDADGQATADLDLPEFSGELRLMAVAYNARQAGSAEAHVRVRRNLIAQPSLPRFLAIGDQCDASVALFNQRPEPVTARIGVTCGGPLRADPADQTIVLPANGATHVLFRLYAGPGTGRATCRVTVQGGGESTDEQIELPVRPAGGLRVAAQSRILKAGEEITLDPPADWLPATVSQSGLISARPTALWQRALDYVTDYPYGCLEQTASSAFPRLAGLGGAPTGAPGAVADGDTGAIVSNAILRVLSMQRADGGFALWPFAANTDPDASLYAIHFLIEARAAGCRIPAGPVEAALDWIQDRLDRAPPGDVSTSEWSQDMEARAYACYVLALAGRPATGWTARLREQGALQSFSTRVLTASALLRSGEPRPATALLDALGMPAPRPRDPNRIFDSTTRDAALLLSAWLDVEPENDAVFRLSVLLISQRCDDHWGNTQDNAMALLALGKLNRILAGAPAAFTGTLRFADGRSRALSGEREERWTSEPGGGSAVTVHNNGPGSLYLAVRTEGVSESPEPETEQGVRIQREFFTLSGAPVNPATARQGDLIVVRLTVDPLGRELDHLAIEDLLPAGWEIENPNLATAVQPSLRRDDLLSVRHLDIRDDRLILFPGPLDAPRRFEYLARAVTPGEFRYPPVVVSDMVEPEIRAVHGGRAVRVTP